MRLDGRVQRTLADLLDIEMEVNAAEHLAPHGGAVARLHVVGGESKRCDAFRDHVPSLSRYTRYSLC